MNLDPIRTLALLEARVRLRRTSTLVTLLAVIALSWLIVPDPAGGQTLMAIDGARVRYTSAMLALGSAAQASLLFALAGFYLLRGRMGEDQRSGMGGVIGASALGGRPFVLGRWCGGVLYLLALVGASMATALACHLVRGEGPIEPLVYLSTYLVVLGPMALFTAGCAVLWESWAPLMGKRGDLLYFVVWVGQMAMLPSATTAPVASALPFDFTGMSAVIAALSAHVDIHNMSLGIADFDPTLAPLTLPASPASLWRADIVAVRAVSALLALVPLWLALCLFHRFSPDRVKPARARARRSPLALLNGWLRPLARLAQPLYRLAARLPGSAGQATADVALTLGTAPTAIALLLAAQVLALVLPTASLAPLVLACVAYWGVLVSDLPTRDGDAGCAVLGAAVAGGAARRYWRQLGAAFMLGLMFTAVAALRLALLDPLRALALLTGLFALAAFAAMLGRLSGSARTFLVLFLFGLYMGVQIHHVPMADVVGFHGTATLLSVLVWSALGAAAAWTGHWFNRGHAA